MLRLANSLAVELDGRLPSADAALKAGLPEVLHFEPIGFPTVVSAVYVNQSPFVNSNSVVVNSVLERAPGCVDAPRFALSDNVAADIARCCTHSCVPTARTEHLLHAIAALAV